MSTAHTVASLLADAVSRLQGPEARFESEVLLAHALGSDRAWLYAHARDPVPVDVEQRFHQLCAQRQAGTPVAQLLGRRGFWTLDLAVSAHTLIPRPETELLVEAALQRLPATQSLEVADLGTGTGAIALALASERPHWRVIATDLSRSALAVAQANAWRLEIDNVRFVQGDWLQPLAGRRLTAIVSNPPYIAEADPHLEQGDLRCEPRMALASGGDGLDALRSIVAAAPALLVAGGWLLVEHGSTQGAAVRALFSAAGFHAADTLCDLEQRERVTLAQLPLST